MKVLTAEFVTSAALRLAPGDGRGLAQGKPPSGMIGIPRDGLAQVAMAGRSNVGKSTLINSLVRTKIARTSAAPGKTRLANVYRITAEGGPGGPGRWSVYFVDLPGYGYARGGADAAQELAAVAQGYFQSGDSGSGTRDSSEDRQQRLRPERGDRVEPAEGGPPSESERGWAASAEAKASSAEASRRRGPASSEQRLRPERGDGVEPAEGGPPSESERGWGPASSERRCSLLLVDSRHPGLPSDLQAHRWLSAVGAAPLVLATKIDKLSRADRVRNLRELERVFGTAALPVSATGGEGLDELWKVIANLARDASRRPTATER